MATNAYIANETSRAEVHTITCTAVSVGGVASFTINSKTVQYTAVTGDTTTSVITGLNTAIQNSTDKEFAQFNTSPSAAILTITASNQIGRAHV